MRVAASAAIPLSTINPDRHPEKGGGFIVLNKLTTINES
jgi:hypothetical protein